MDAENLMVETILNAWAVELDCGCKIALPHQSPLGIYTHLQNPAKGTWPATFLCLRHELASARQSSEVRLRTDILHPTHSLHEIEIVCETENCEAHHTLFAASAEENADATRGAIHSALDKHPTFPCDGHALLWTDNRIKVTQIYSDIGD